MALHLDDNERGAFHYLIGGVVLVLALRGLAWGLDAFHAPALPAGDDAVLEPFRQGYLTGEGVSVAATGAGRMERLALALVVGVAGALVLGGAAAIVAHFLKGRPGRVAVITMRCAMVLLLGWSVHAALFAPVRQAAVEEGGLLLRERTPLIGDLTVPFTLREEHIPHTAIARLEAARVPCERGCDGTVRIGLFLHDGRSFVLAEQRGICPADELASLRGASEAAALLERGMH